MKKLLVSLSTFAVFTGALAVPTFAATEVNTVNKTNSQVLLVKPAFDVNRGGIVSLYSVGIGYYEVYGYGLSVYKQGGTWYLNASPNAQSGTLYAYDTNGNFIRTYNVTVH
ncbi:hypothetical protein [Brevibacillus halotolerans]|uniref:hypothetical protein n=1 Tax=Brevibacillus halotolerans TaxID=1507437 RepID=UPI0015EF7C5B|nr:hypothetical protein [Brevibacillus halotolerans]MBA4535172.1 hypothetical protein [Brevibacillus halotolerans]